LIRSRSLVVGPARKPPSRSACRIQRRNVSAVQPIFVLIDPIAAHCEPCSCWCYCTNRTARSCTSGENFDFLIAPSSQRKEPPGKPGRFITVAFRLCRSNITASRRKNSRSIVKTSPPQSSP
jgi:hypothetical protein